MNPNIETFIGCDCGYEEADMVLYGAPFDSTTSFRPGARFGPSAIRHESFGLETYSPVSYTHLDVYKRQGIQIAPGSDRQVLRTGTAAGKPLGHAGALV